MAHGAAADKGFRHLGHADGALHPGRHALLLERVLEREGVEERREHAGIVVAGVCNPRSGAHAFVQLDRKFKLPFGFFEVASYRGQLAEGTRVCTK